MDLQTASDLLATDVDPDAMTRRQYLTLVAAPKPPAPPPAEVAGADPAPGDTEPVTWWDLANCRGTDPDLFFTERGEPTAEAKAVCAGCVVREACLEHALTAPERFGIWGGLSEWERQRIRRARRRAARERAAS